MDGHSVAGPPALGRQVASDLAAMGLYKALGAGAVGTCGDQQLRQLLRNFGSAAVGPALTLNQPSSTSWAWLRRLLVNFCLPFSAARWACSGPGSGRRPHLRQWLADGSGRWHRSRH